MHPSLAKHSIVIFGLGPTGGSTAQLLCAAGIGRICLVDTAQMVPSGAGLSAIASGGAGQVPQQPDCEKLSREYPNVKIERCPDRFDAHNAERLVEQYDVVIDNFSNWQDKLLASDICMQLHKPLLHSGCLGYNFQLFDMLPSKSACLRCAFQIIGLDDLTRLTQTTQPFGPTSMMAGAMLASEAIKILTGIGSAPGDEFLQFDGLKRQFYVTRAMTPHADCPDCGRWIS